MTNDTSTATAPAPAAVGGSDPRDVLARAMATAVEVIAAVRPDQMELPTPCDDYDVRGLIAHLVAVLDRLEMFGTRGDIGSVGVQSEILADDEWVGRWDTTVHRVLDAWADDSRLDAEMPTTAPARLPRSVVRPSEAPRYADARLPRGSAQCRLPR